MDLSFTDDERAFAAEVREWLTENVEHPPPFESVDDEVAWGRRWQAKLAAGRDIPEADDGILSRRDQSPLVA